MLEKQPGSNRFLVKIADLELLPIYKYANTFADYRNASVWSPPECLQLMRKVQDPTPEMDIYSFSMIMWEIWHETLPFDGDLPVCQQYVVQEDSRPMIENEKIDPEIAKIIRLCWQAAPEKRLKFTSICKLLLQNI